MIVMHVHVYISRMRISASLGLVDHHKVSFNRQRDCRHKHVQRLGKHRKRPIYWWLSYISGCSNMSASIVEGAHRSTGCYKESLLSHPHWTSMWNLGIATWEMRDEVEELILSAKPDQLCLREIIYLNLIGWPTTKRRDQKARKLSDAQESFMEGEP